MCTLFGRAQLKPFGLRPEFQNPANVLTQVQNASDVASQYFVDSKGAQRSVVTSEARLVAHRLASLINNKQYSDGDND